jgi:DNA (cytosine-5)-methyltransferase 1
MRPLVYGSVCSGIEAATAAWHPLGWRPAFFSEIDNFPRAVLQHHYPDVPLHGDFTTIQEHDYDPIDLLVGGTPCQAFSVAGLRKGFADERGNLTLEFVKLAQRLRPRWVVWENVPGVLSIDRGRAFGSFLGTLAECGYGFAYRVLDAQHFGVPQRRRRVFVVGYLGDWRPPAAVLFERESLLRDITPSREAGEKPAPTISARTKGGGGLGTDFDLDGGLIGCWWDGGQVSQTLDAVLSKGQTMPEKNRFPAVLQPVTHSLRAGGFDASEDGTGRGTPLVPVAYNVTFCDANGRRKDRPNGGLYVSETELSKTVTAGGDSSTYIAFSCKDHGADAGDTAPTLRAMGHSGSHANAGGQLAVAFQQNTRDELRYIGGDGQIAGALAAQAGMKQQNYIQQLMAVRRLTPRECERLQGFTDDFTLVPYGRTTKAKLAADFLKYLMRGGRLTEDDCHGRAADGPRYKSIGNSKAVPCVRWIGERIDLVRQLMEAA